MTTSPQADPDFVPSQTQPPTSGGDPDFIPTQMQPPQHWYDTAVHELGELNTGFTTGLSQTGATAERAIGHIPVVGPAWNRATAQAQTDDATRAATPLNTGGRVAGNAIENIIEFAAGDEALKGASMLTKMNELKPIVEAAKKSPTLVRILANAAKNAAVSGGQTALHGGSLADVGKSALAGGALSAGGETAANAISEGREALQTWRPTSLNLAGADFPISGRTGELLAPALTPGATDPATAAVDEASSNLGKRAAMRSLARTQAARPTKAVPISDKSRLLPSPRAVDVPETASSLSTNTPLFSVPTTEPRVNEVAQPTAEGGSQVVTTQKQVPNPDYEPLEGGNMQNAERELGSTAGTIPDRVMGGPRSASQMRLEAARGNVPERMVTGEPTTTATEQNRFYTPPPAGSGGPGAQLGGGGPMILTNDGAGMSVAQARAQQARYETMMGSDEWDELGPRLQAAIQTAHEDISEQLHRFDNFAASQPHLAQPSTPDVLANTNSIGDAGKQLKAAHAPFWVKADELSEGRFSDLRNQEKALQDALRSEGRTGPRTTLRNQLAENQRQQMQFFDQNRTQLSPDEFAIARSGYQDGAVLDNFHNLIESHVNGITKADVADAAAAGKYKLDRVFDPGKNFNSEVEDFLNTDQNRAVLERTIGRDGVLDVKKIGQLFEDSTRQDATRGLFRTIQQSVRLHRYGLGGIVGGGLGWGLGHGLGEVALAAGAGAAGAGTVSGTMRYITDHLISDPEFAKSFIYAAKNGVPPRIAGPLLAAKMLGSGVRAAASSAMIPTQQPGAQQ